MKRARLIAFCAVALLACRDNSRTRRVPEEFVLVPGTATVDDGRAQVLTDPVRETGNFVVSSARQCDVFQQLSVRKVDILWVIDSSGSMAPKQQRLKDNFRGFIQQLANANPPIDFHIAVVSTDTDDAQTRGKLRPWSLNSRNGNYIACTPQTTGSTLCNTSPSLGDTSSAVVAFQQMANVGINGSAQERGLLSAYLALTAPENLSAPGAEKFIRQDAALYVVVVSDEDDASCSPLAASSVCTADPGCRCSSDAILNGAGNWGSTAYFTRFLETYKGYGNADLVALAAIVAVDDGPDAGVPSQFLDAVQHSGCCRSASGAPCPKSGLNAAAPDSGIEVAYTGARYIKVANETGGVAVSICSDDSSMSDGGTPDGGFGGALASLGYAASGLRTEFRLARGPQLRAMQGVANGLELYVAAPNAAMCMVDGNCPANQKCRNGKCAVKSDVLTGANPTGAQYVKCDGTTLRNIVRFTQASVPPSLATVEICYDVEPTFQNSCP